MVKTDEIFYEYLKDRNNYDLDTMRCMENTLIKLESYSTSTSNPGMMLGKVQSGKTRTYIGLIGLAFDNKYDIAIILTKGTKALAHQTYERLRDEFNTFVEDDYVQIYDIMNMPTNLTQYELDQKLIFIVKKETNNLNRLENALTETYSSLKNKKTLIIDDEADYASIGFKKTKKEIFQINRIAGQIDALRKSLTDVEFLQVTATPYSLYLQPDSNIVLSGDVFKPTKPAFTEIVPHGSGYIGGEYYFHESQEDSNIAFYLYESIREDELDVLRKSDGRKFKIEDGLHSHRIKSLRRAILNFLVGGTIRRLQDKERRIRQQKYSFIIHTEQRRSSHRWQKEIILKLIEDICLIIEKEPLFFHRLIREAYDRMTKSLELLNTKIPLLEDVIFCCEKALIKGYVMVTKVNSTKDVNELLDESGELKLRVPFNIFIGGQILDRGITINNLIGFYYGRNPQTYQQDTVLQHSRMFGYRDEEDLAVTRLYTTPKIYKVMQRINEFDVSLRKSITNQNDQSVVFIQRDNENNIIPCNPNKVILSRLTTLQAHKRMLPTGFQTLPTTRLKSIVKKIDEKINYMVRDYNERLVDLEDALEIIKMINDTFDIKKGEEWDFKSFDSSLEYLSVNSPTYPGKVWVVIRKDRNISRIRKGSGRFEDAPDTPKGERSELRVARELAIDTPALILLRQNGHVENGWRGSPFWWPVLIAPASTPPVVFAHETIDI